MAKINIYVRKKQDKLIKKVIVAAIEGLEYLNEDFEIRYENEYKPSEIAILYGLHKNINATGRKRKAIYDGQKYHNKKTMVFERGYFKREEYHSVGWNWINGKADFKNKNCPSDRFDRLNLDIKDWGPKGDNIIFCGQVPWDSAVQHINKNGKGRTKKSVQGYMEWLSKTARVIRDFSDKPIIFRPHPLFKHKEWYKEYLPEYVSWSDNDMMTDLQSAHACVVFNSNSAVDAIIQGIPIFVMDQGSVAYSVANKSLKKINKPKNYDITQWANNLAYAQWNLEEIKRGEFWKHLNSE